MSVAILLHCVDSGLVESFDFTWSPPIPRVGDRIKTKSGSSRIVTAVEFSYESTKHAEATTIEITVARE